jgi:hypothetical protein
MRHHSFYEVLMNTLLKIDDQRSVVVPDFLNRKEMAQFNLKRIAYPLSLLQEIEQQVTEKNGGKNGF